MSEPYKGFKEFDVHSHIIDEIHDVGYIDALDKRHTWYPNMYVEMRSVDKPKHTALGKVDKTGKRIIKIESNCAAGVEPRNREQVFALDALMDDNIPIVTLTGSAGTGKTILAIAAAMQQIQNHRYKKCIITKPMSQVGRYQLGTLPGDVSEKFNPYLINYTTNMEQLVGPKNVEILLEQAKFEAYPLQLVRGASFTDCLIIADEMQVLDHHEMLTVGTRLGEGSKLILMGDLNQRDEKIAKDKTGLHTLMTHLKFKESHLAASIELQRCERSDTARLFAEVFEE